MKMNQKLPMALGLICAMMLSSCSKEDMQTAEPQNSGAIENSGLRSSGNINVNPNILNVTPVFPSTSGPAGQNVFPNFWSANPENASPATYVSGTSTLAYLWGNQSLPWQQALPQIPSNLTQGYVVTIATGETAGSVTHYEARAQTKLRNLIAGKQYTIKFWVATTMRQTGAPLLSPTYAKAATVALGTPGQHITSSSVDFTNKIATWVEKSITFTASSTEMLFTLSGYNEKKGKLSYVHIFVDKNAIKVVN